MPSRTLNRSAIATLFVVVALTAGLSAPAGAASTDPGQAASPLSGANGPLINGRSSTCFWYYGPVGAQPDYNVAYPDASARYFAAFFRRPEGSTLTLSGSYPYARYFSLISYGILGTVVDGLADYQIDPDAGSTNPFRPGAQRFGKQRAWTVSLIQDKNPGFNKNAKSNEPVRNSMYMVPATNLTEDTPSGPVDITGIVLRVYVPNSGLGITGDVEMPTPTLTLADGTKFTGQAACDAMDSQSKALGRTRVPDPTSLLLGEKVYDALRYPNKLTAACSVLANCSPVTAPYPGIAPQQSALVPLVQLPVKSVPATFPATNPVKWRAQYNRRYLLQLWTGDKAPGAETKPERIAGGGFFPNLHNNYVRTALNRKFGKVVVVKGKLPTSPATFAGEKTFGVPGKKYQTRYTSYCMNESVRSTRVMACLYDEQIPVDAKGNFTIVVSRTADRPKNATAKCHTAWLGWSKNGDGAVDFGDALTDLDFGWLQIRNMLPDPTFKQAIQNTKKPGDEKAVMGQYMPSVTYTSKAAFQAKGCSKRAGA